MFHHFHDPAHPAGGGSIDAEELRRLIDHVGRHRFVTAVEFLERHAEGTLAPETLCLTFDDALRCQYDVAVPVLERLGLTGFWFVYTAPLEGSLEPLEIYRAFRLGCFETIEAFYGEFEAFVGPGGLETFNPRAYLAEFPFYTDADRRFRYLRDEVLGPHRYHTAMSGLMALQGVTPESLARNLWMTPAHLRNLHAAGHVVGLHSHTHPTRLARLSLSDQRREYQTNYQSLHRMLGTPPTTMSHPCNSYCPATLKLLRDMGITLGFRANMAPQPRRSMLELPREDHANLMKQIRQLEEAA